MTTAFASNVQTAATLAELDEMSVSSALDVAQMDEMLERLAATSEPNYWLKNYWMEIEALEALGATVDEAAFALRSMEGMPYADTTPKARSEAALSFARSCRV